MHINFLLDKIDVMMSFYAVNLIFMHISSAALPILIEMYSEETKNLIFH